MCGSLRVDCDRGAVFVGQRPGSNGLDGPLSGVVQEVVLDSVAAEVRGVDGTDVRPALRVADYPVVPPVVALVEDGLDAPLAVSEDGVDGISQIGLEPRVLAVVVRDVGRAARAYGQVERTIEIAHAVRGDVPYRAVAHGVFNKAVLRLQHIGDVGHSFTGQGQRGLRAPVDVLDRPRESLRWSSCRLGRRRRRSRCGSRGAAGVGVSSNDPPPHATATTATKTPISETVTRDVLSNMACLSLVSRPAPYEEREAGGPLPQCEKVPSATLDAGDLMDDATPCQGGLPSLLMAGWRRPRGWRPRCCATPPGLPRGRAGITGVV